MLGRIALIAFQTYRESVRARVLFGLAALALGTAAYSLAVGSFSMKSAPRIVSDLGAASISFFAVIVAIFLATSSLYREIEQKTIFPLLARPIHRTEYVIGKFGGTVLTLFVFIAFNAAAVLLLVSSLAGLPLWQTAGVAVTAITTLVGCARFLPRQATWAPIPIAAVSLVLSSLLAAVAPDERRVVLGSGLLSLLEVAIVAGLATLFASFSSPFLSAVFTLGLFLVGRSADTLAKLPAHTFGPLIPTVGRFLAQVVPNLQTYVPPRSLLTGEAVSVSLSSYLATASLHSVAWATALVTAASLIFRKRDFL